VNEVASYFGEEIAFYFTWLGFYTKWTFYSLVMGLILFFTSFIHNDNGWSATIYAIFITIWTTCFFEFWKRTENQCAYEWNMTEFEDEERVRPEYQGDDRVGVWRLGVWVDLSDAPADQRPPPIKYYKTGSTSAKMALSFTIIAVLAMLVIIATVAILSFRLFVQRELVLKTHFSFAASLGGVIGAMANAAFIMILNKIYCSIATLMNDWENHRTIQAYNTYLSIKIFLFTFVNTNTSLFYIAYIKRNTALWGVESLRDLCNQESSSSGDTWPIWNGCTSDLTSQVSSLLIFNLVVGQALELVFPFITPYIGQFLIFRRKEEKKHKGAAKSTWLFRQCGYCCSFFSRRGLDNSRKALAQYELEGTLNQCPGLIDEFSEMALQFGLITMFAAAFPLAPLIAFANNMIEGRTDAYKFVKLYAKPNWVGSNGIGIWYNILYTIGILAIVNNCLLVGFSYTPIRDVLQDRLEDSTPYQVNYYVLWTVVLLEHLVLLISFVISSLIPDVSSDVKVKVAKSYYLKELKLRDTELLDRQLAERAEISDQIAQQEQQQLLEDVSRLEKYKAAHAAASSSSDAAVVVNAPPAGDPHTGDSAV
jgi:ribosomal protein L19